MSSGYRWGASSATFARPIRPTSPPTCWISPRPSAARSSSRQGSISFHHDLDSLARDPAHPDEGTVHRKDNVMYERGPGFEEHWLASSLPGDDVAVAELHGSGSDGGPPLARLVRIGSVALAVWGGAAPGGAQFSKANGWQVGRHLAARRQQHDDRRGSLVSRSGRATTERMGHDRPRGGLRWQVYAAWCC